MAETWTASNSWMCYIQNQPYVYPVDHNTTTGTAGYNTGWHIIPNMLWEHYVTPKQWADLIINYEAYSVKSVSVKVFNMIPMTQQLAIQGNTIFTAFNNCIYCLGYEDDLYETSWENYYAEGYNNYWHNLIYKEGLICNYNADTKRRFELPIYIWQTPNARPRSARSYENWDQGSNTLSAVYPAGTAAAGSSNNYADRPTGVCWDPMNRPDKLMELRPGKNTIGYSWNVHDCDVNKWFNLDQLAWWSPYKPEGPYAGDPRPGEYVLTSNVDPDRLSSKYETSPWINDYTIPNWNKLPICPMAWWWKEMQESIAPYSNEDGHEYIFKRRISQMFCGTEAELFKYGPHQMFIKMIPLFDSNGTHIAASANISVQTTLTLNVRKRRSAIYCPTWGPFSWYDLYCAGGLHQRFAPSLVRYKTGGMRRTWQNVGDAPTTIVASGTYAQAYPHPRETPYNWTQVVASGTGAGQTRSAAPVVQYSKSKDQATIVTPARRKPKMSPAVAPRLSPITVETEMEELPGSDSTYVPIDQYRK